MKKNAGINVRLLSTFQKINTCSNVETKTKAFLFDRLHVLPASPTTLTLKFTATGGAHRGCKQARSACLDSALADLLYGVCVCVSGRACVCVCVRACVCLLERERERERERAATIKLFLEISFYA